MRRTILGVVVAACAVAMAAPMAQAATQLNVEFTDIGVHESGETADNIVNVTEPALNQTRISDPAGVFSRRCRTASRSRVCRNSVHSGDLHAHGARRLVVYTNFGDDRVTVGPHGADEGVHVSLHYGNDFADTANGSLDNVSCGPGVDTATTDAFDTFLPDSGSCNDGGGGGGGSGGGGAGGGGGGGGGSITPPIATPITPVANLVLGPVLSPHRGKLLVAARVNGPGLVTGKAYKGKKLVAKGSAKATQAGAVTLMIKPTKAGKRLLKSKPKVKVKLKLAFKPTTGATVIKTINTRIRR